MTSTYLQPYIAQGNAASYESYEWIAKGQTYCYENGSANPTRVHYVGEVLFDGQAIENDFYVWSRFVGSSIVTTAYKDWAALKAAKADISDAIAENDAALKAQGVKRYKSGRCYYEADIYTAASQTTTIVRNNWYKLTVKTINDLGTPDPVIEEEDKKTYLIIEALVNPWTINVNDFNL